jgi:hypothetical protein
VGRGERLVEEVEKCGGGHGVVLDLQARFGLAFVRDVVGRVGDEQVGRLLAHRGRDDGRVAGVSDDEAVRPEVPLVADLVSLCWQQLPDVTCLMAAV